MNPFKLLIDALRAICFFLDKIVYFFIPLFYKLLLYLARVDLVSGNIPVQALIQRIYILVGVFMLFRLSFSIMNYIVNPDAFSDQAKGFTNLVKRVLIAIVLLVSVPFIFAKAYEYQGKILTSGILPRLVLGEANSYENGSGTDQLEKSIDTSAKDVQFLVFGPFFSLNYHSSDLADCDPAQTGESTSHILGTTGMARSDSCLTTVAEFFDNDKEIKSSGTLLSDFFRISSDGKELEDDSRDFSSFGNLVSWSLSDGKYAINYNPIISTICGGYLAFLLLSFCIDVAARVIRLLFLQILSPVAIISSIDPTTSGDRLKEWAKECLKVWLSLFIRLLIIFIIIQLVRVITDTIYNGEYELEGGGIVPWIFIFLVLGVFQAAKNIPEYIEKATGIKMSGELQLNPFKNSAIVAATGVGVGAAVGGFAGFRAGIEAGAPMRGVLGGIVTGMGKGREEKLGVGMMGNIRRKTYKDMTGSELSTFNPWQKLYGIGGQQKVEATKTQIDSGRDMLNRVHSQLNAVSHMNAQRYTFLSNAGYDMAAADTRKMFESLMKDEKVDESYKTQITDLRKQQADLRKQGFGIHSQEVRDVDARLAKAMSLEQKAYNDFIANMNNMGISRDVYDSGKQYIEGLEQEDDLRAEIGQLEKAISTLDDQKRQQEQFYHIDSSPKESVEKALGTISDFRKKYPDKNGK